jgi:ankyrin repeat protein
VNGPERDDYELVLAALADGRLDALEELAVLIPGFPEGEDSFLGRRWIINAIDVGTLTAIEWVIGKGVDLSFQDQGGYTPLHAALERDAGRYDLLELLLTAGAPVNARGVNDWTPAHMAAVRDDVEALRILAAHGADLTIRTNIDDYATPLEEARILGSEKAVRYWVDLESRRGTVPT